MSLTKEIIVSRFEIQQEFKTVSIRLDTVIKEDSKELSRSCHRQSFVPGQIEEVKAFLGVIEGPEVDYLNALWTEEVIANYKVLLEAGE